MDSNDVQWIGTHFLDMEDQLTNDQKLLIDEKTEMNIICIQDFLAQHPAAGQAYPSGYDEIRTFHLKKAIVMGKPPLIIPFSSGVKLADGVLDECTNYGHTRLAIEINTCLNADPAMEYHNCVLLNQMWCDTFFHWMLESLIKLIIFEQQGFTGLYVVPAGVAFIKESLELFSIPPKRIIEYTEPFIAFNLLLTDKFTHYQLCRYPVLLDRLRSVLTSAAETSSDNGRACSSFRQINT